RGVPPTLHRRAHAPRTAVGSRGGHRRRERPGAGSRRATVPRARRPRLARCARCRLGNSPGRARMSILEQLRLLHAGWRDVLEVAIVSYAIYRVLLILHRTRAMQVLAGMIVLAVAYGIAYVLQLGMIVYLLTLVFSYG